jgi:hypothetical protein
MVLKNIKDPVLVNNHSKLFSNFSYLWKNNQIFNATKLEIIILKHHNLQCIHSQIFNKAKTLGARHP